MSNYYHGIIFTGMGDKTLSRPAGAVRIRTWLKKHNYNTEVVDFFGNFSPEELIQVCKNYITEETLFVGISSTFLNNFNKVNFLFNHIKETYPHVKTIIGGTESELVLLDTTTVDRYIWGYSEEAILHYLDFLSGKRDDDLEWYPFRDSLAIDAEKKYKNDDSDLTIEWKESDNITINYVPLEISRGCIFRCKFCQFPLLGKKKFDYIRNEDNLVDELKNNWERWGINNYQFQDDTYNDNIVKLEYVANAIEKSGVKITYSAFLRADLLAAYPETIDMMVDTGLIAVSFGIESLHQKARSTIGKGGNLEKQLETIKLLKSKAPIWTFTGLIAGLPHEPIESLYKTQEWFIEQQGVYFDRWEWFPLGIKNSSTRRSEFDKDYKKYGYTVDDENAFYLNWKNDQLTFLSALDLSLKFNNDTKKYRAEREKLGTWPKFAKVMDKYKGLMDVMEMTGVGIEMKDIIHNTFDVQKIEQFLEKHKNDLEKYKNWHMGLN